MIESGRRQHQNTHLSPQLAQTLGKHSGVVLTRYFKPTASSDGIGGSQLTVLLVGIVRTRARVVTEPSEKGNLDKPTERKL